MKKISLLLFFCLWPIYSAGQDLNIRVDRLIDGRGNPVKNNMVVVIRDGKIAEILPFSKFKKRKKIFLDARGHTLLPGLIDVHIHLGSAGGTKQIAAEYNPKMAYRLLRATLACGVTAVRSLCDDRGWIFKIRSAERKGEIISPRIYAVGPAFSAPGGHPTEFFRYDPKVLRETVEQVTSAKEAVKALDKLIKTYGPDGIKIVYGGGNKQGKYIYPRLSKRACQAIIQGAHAKGLRVMVHVDRKKEAMEVLKMGADGIEHVPYGMDQEVWDLLKKKHAFFVPTLSVHYSYSSAGDQSFQRWIHGPYVKKILPRIVPFSLKLYGKSLIHPPLQKFFGLLLHQGQKGLAKNYGLGVKIACGSDAGNPYTFHGAGLIKEIELMVQGGLTPLQAIRCATQYGAQHLGLANKIGTIEKGKWADLVLVMGNPAKDIRDLYRVSYVVKGGRLYSRGELELRKESSLPGKVKVYSPTITHFEKATLLSTWGASWYVLTDRVMGGKSTGKLEIQGRKKYMKFSGKIRRGTTGYAFASIQMDSTARGWQTLDGSAFRGIQLTLKGTPGPIYLGVGSEGVPGFYHYSRRVVVTEKWREIKIPFSSLYGWGPGKKFSFDPGRITLFRLGVMGPKERAFEVDLREMRFYK